MPGANWDVSMYSEQSGIWEQLSHMNPPSGDLVH